jgi:hypothetical protein
LGETRSSGETPTAANPSSAPGRTRNNAGPAGPLCGNVAPVKNLVAGIMGVIALSLCMAVVAQAPKKGKSRLRHVVSFKFKDSATPADIKKVEDAFSGLKGKIPQIQGLEWGTNNSPEGLNKGCTHGWILTFGSEKDRDAYLVHPDHQEFGKLVKPLVADVFVIDFWTRD